MFYVLIYGHIYSCIIFMCYVHIVSTGKLHNVSEGNKFIFPP